ncbi:bifunctional glutamate/proline--tRNA ligase [Bombus flavifrons]|uniref:bifunctional glutamate/proline--tRNA ligase n=1 Tax=Bombus flavifrons TaxID=103934 RepID=UPI003703A507
MTYKVIVDSKNPPTDALIVLEVINSQNKEKIEIVWCNDWKDDGNIRLTDSQNKVLGKRSSDVSRYFARTTCTDLYGGVNPREKTEVDHWLSFAIGPLEFYPLKEDALSYLDNILMTNTWLVSKKLTIADIHVFCTLVDKKFLTQFEKKFINITRWYKQVLSLSAVTKALLLVKKNAKLSLHNNVQSEKAINKQTGQRKQEGKFIDLPGAEMGRVIVRFPPEASGYLHIGHAKAALLNQYYAQTFQGQFIMRFDDTNPAKENVEFEKAILEDLELLQIKPDRFTHSSDYFDLMLEYCTKLIKDGKAYVDNTPADIMKEQRDQKLMSSNRNNSIEQNLELWNEMQQGTVKGQECCVRAKIDYQSTNGCLRDPTIYRCKPEPHPRTGTKYKVYPIYDFACPIVDAVENVTHTLRTTEYHDRDVQFYWIIDALGLRRPYIWEYSRLNMTHTVLSKRKLTWFVDQGLVDGWDDPRFPTVRGILRRGMTVEGLKQFIIAQGSSKSVVFMEWDKIWAFNKKVIDPVATRYTALEYNKIVPVHIDDAKEEWLTVQNHPKDITKGTKQVLVGSQVYIERDDANLLTEGQNATFINWGNILIKKIERENDVIKRVVAQLNLENKDYKNTLKITWLSIPSDKNHDVSKVNLIPCYAVYFDHIISKSILGKDDDYKDFIAKNTRTEIQMLGEVALKHVEKGEIIQLQRKGFFRCDVSYAPVSPFSSREQPLILFHIPDGHTNITKSIPTGSTPASVKEISQKNKQTLDTNLINEKIVVRLEEIGTPGTTLNKSQMISDENKLSENTLSENIIQQESRIKKLQSEINQEMQRLSNLKTEYKNKTGNEWTGVKNQNITKDILTESHAVRLYNEIQKQGDKVRQLKSLKAEKSVIDEEVKKLLALKSDYKSVTGQDWKPSTIPTTDITNKDENSAVKISESIQKQGDKVRQLKSSKAEKGVIDEEVKRLLALKSDYKSVTGQDWKPSTIRTTDVTNKDKHSVDKISESIQKQGDKVRQLKSSKAEKSVIDEEVKKLLALKSDYKSVTGQDWKPSTIPTTDVTNKDENSADKISESIQKQGDKVRQLKSSKAEKSVIDEEVKKLLALKSDYKSVTGQDWKPSTIPTTDVTNKDENSANKISESIQKQGDKVRQLKSSKAEKSVIDEEVKKLLALKSDYKSVTGQDWKPSTIPTTDVTNKDENSADKISESIQKQGDKVKKLKEIKTDKSIIDQEIKILLDLKNNYKALTGQEWKSIPDMSKKKKEDISKREKQNTSNKEISKNESMKDVDIGKTRLGLEARKEENFFEWYSQIITKSGMIEYYDVSGCYVYRPWSFAVWKMIKEYIDKEITQMGVQECYFPMFVTRTVLEKEKKHIADFAPEVAWVTKCGESDLAEPIAIRPTSETVMYPAYAKWLKSDTELPLKLNQWNNVVRWEFKDPKPFLRTREFLWQEGHSAFATKAEADEEVMIILDLYARVYEDLLAIPVVKGRKTEKEKFAGGDYTTTVEAFISTSGRAIQGATSHHLGQNFSKMFNIQVENAVEGNEKTFVYQNSWGLTTRTIGVMIMVHGDDKGLVLPPNVACIQAIIVPCGITASTTPQQRELLFSECNKLLGELSKDSLRVKADYRSNRTPGWKFNHWELKGVPVRIEVGPKDLNKNQVTFVRRDNSERVFAKRPDVVTALHTLLTSIQADMLSKAKKNLNEHIKRADNWNEFCSYLNEKNILLSPFCGESSCEDKIKRDSAREDTGGEIGTLSMGAKSLCIPFEQPPSSASFDKQTCIHPDCQNKPQFYTLFGRSY